VFTVTSDISLIIFPREVRSFNVICCRYAGGGGEKVWIR
jgi:hypothetical protein